MGVEKGAVGSWDQLPQGGEVIEWRDTNMLHGSAAKDLILEFLLTSFVISVRLSFLICKTGIKTVLPHRFP